MALLAEHCNVGVKSDNKVPRHYAARRSCKRTYAAKLKLTLKIYSATRRVRVGVVRSWGRGVCCFYDVCYFG